MSNNAGLSKEEAVNKTFEEQLAAAANKLAIMPRRSEGESENATVQESLPDLNALPDANPTGEILQAIKDEVARKKQWAHGAGAKLLELEQEFKALKEAREADPDIMELSPQFAERWAALEEAIAVIGSVGDELKRHVHFAKLIEEIRRSGESFDAVAAIFNRAVEEGWLRVASEEEVEHCRNQADWPAGKFFFGGKFYFRKERPGRELLSPARQRFEKELRQLLKRASTAERQRRIVLMKERGVCQAPELLQGKKGNYYFRGGNPDDHLLLEVDDRLNDFHRMVRTVNVVDALGSFQWMKADGFRQSAPLDWVLAQNVLSEQRLPEKDYQRAMSLIQQINRLARREKSERS